MDFVRSCGTLVHPTSFPSDFAIGDLGKGAYGFIDFLEQTNQAIWQILPLGPTGFGNSPYASYSAFAGNPYLVSPEMLKEKGLLTEEELAPARVSQSDKTDYEKAYEIKDRLLSIACKRFYERDDADEQRQFKAFKQENSEWLDDYVLFMACLIDNGRKPWNQWDKALAKREKKALDNAKKQLNETVDAQYWVQFEFFNQWMSLRKYANERSIKIIGDIPIFVDHNSADVWANKEYFEVDETGNRLLVAGVPPDYFSDTGQLWGNPLYRWKKLENKGYKWWIDRFRQMFHMFDAIRVDHFRGFDAYWEVAADAETAQNGRWVKGPGEKLFVAIEKELGKLPIIAEDLGVITPSVVALRDRFNFPGMKVLQFAFDDPGNGFLPHNYTTSNCIVYSGTHDNDTSLGWYRQAPEKERNYLREYTRSDGSEVSWELIRLGMLSVANQAIFPLQDFMALDGEHRMNFPGTTENNWMWRYTDEMFQNVDQDKIRHIIAISNRNFKDVRSDSNISDIEAEEA
ncbi:4-alpha-glucanotransferase [Balneolales bacterium ANBcel1]|nr:4-alpha-glucanotransferase [Balneolales bacterium ANBcel1]